MPKNPEMPPMSKALREYFTAWGSIGGKKGGAAGAEQRNKNLTPARRKQIARRAAKARWAKEKKKGAVR